MTKHKRQWWWWCCFLVLGCSGCSQAPAVNVLGSFFPAWMLCLTFGIVAAVLLRQLLAGRGVENKIALLAVFYPSLVVAVACTLWFVLFR